MSLLALDCYRQSPTLLKLRIDLAFLALLVKVFVFLLVALHFKVEFQFLELKCFDDNSLSI